MADATQEILELEKRRSKAINDRDGAALSELMHDDYWHIHAGGRETNKAETVENFVNNPRTNERGDLRVRVYGDSAVIVGPMTNKFDDGREMVGKATQVLVREGGKWRFVSMQFTLNR